MIIFKNKINIAHIVVALDVGGLENGIINLINNKINDNIQYFIFCIKKEGSLANRLKPGQAQLILMEQKHKNNIFRAMEFYRAFKKNKISIVHTHGWGQGSFSAIIGAKFAGVPVIINGEHGTFFLDSKIQIFAQKMISCLCDHIITVSESLKKSVVKFFSLHPDKVTVIPNGVDLKRFENKIDEKSKKKEVGIPDGYHVIGTVGRLVEVKNHQLILKAASYFKNKDIKLQFVIIGDGPLRKMLFQMTKELEVRDEVHFLGIRNDVNELLQLIDIFILPSHKEGMSNTILEAMSVGIPVIAANVGGNSELVINGITGYLFEDDNLLELISKIEDMLNDKDFKSKFGINGKSRVVNEFSVIRMVRGYEDLYCEFLRRKGVVI